MKYVSPFQPNAWQKEVYCDKSRIVVMSGTAGSGKSRVAGEKIHAVATKYPGSSSLILRKAARELNNTVLLPFDTTVIKGCTNVKRQTSKAYYEYNNGSRIFYGGMYDDREREKIRGIGSDGEIDFIWMDEGSAFLAEDFEEAMGRLRGIAAPWQQFLITTNPDSKEHWIYKRLIETKKASCYFSSWKNNPRYQNTNYGKSLAELSGVRYKRLAEGLWVTAEGAVYEEFDTTLHVIKPFEIPRSWRRIRSIDFGFKNPFVCQWWAIDHDDRMYLYRELYAAEKIVEDWAKLISEMTGKEHIGVTVTDHDAEDRATLERHGISSIAAWKDIVPGIQNIQARLRIQRDGKARLYMFENALKYPDDRLISTKKPYSTQQEFASYVYEKGKDGKPIKEEPVKKDDHGMDAMRYAAAYVDGLRDRYASIPNDPMLAKNVDRAFSDLSYQNPFSSRPNPDAWWMETKEGQFS